MKRGIFSSAVTTATWPDNGAAGRAFGGDLQFRSVNKYAPRLLSYSLGRASTLTPVLGNLYHRVRGLRIGARRTNTSRLESQESVVSQAAPANPEPAPTGTSQPASVDSENLPEVPPAVRHRPTFPLEDEILPVTS